MAVTMTDVAPPEPGQTLWGDDLNTYLLSLEARIASNEARMTALEAKPEHIYSSAPWQFSNAAPPSTGNQVRLNNTNPSLATVIDIRRLDSDGADRSAAFQLVDVGAVIRISDWNDSTAYHQFRPTGQATFTADNAQIPVTWETGVGTIPNAKANVGFLLESPF